MGLAKFAEAVRLSTLSAFEQRFVEKSKEFLKWCGLKMLAGGLSCGLKMFGAGFVWWAVPCFFGGDSWESCRESLHDTIMKAVSD